MARYDFMSMPDSPFAEPAILPSFDKLVKAWEKLRELNTGGYGSGVLAQIQGAGRGWLAPDGSGVTSCSPFTGTVLGMIFSNDSDSPYKPVFNGSDPLPGAFYTMQNGDLNADVSKLLKDNGVKLETLKKDWRLDNTLLDSAGAPVWFNLAEAIGYCWKDPDSGKSGRSGSPEKMRRGDLLKIEWYSNPFGKDQKRVTSGHATFCWDVHLDANGDVDAFQFLSANGVHGAGGVGISVVSTKEDGKLVTKSGKKYTKAGNVFTDILDGKDYPHYAEDLAWYALPDIKPGSIDKSTFRVSKPGKKVTIIYWGESIWAREIKVARLKGITPPDPYPQPGKDDKGDTKHFVVTPQSTEKPDEVQHQPAPQIKEAPAEFQSDVEKWLQIFWKAKWITSDPGESADVNDAKSQAAIKEFQEKYTKEKPTGVADKDTRKRLQFFAEYALKQKDIETQLKALKDAGKLTKAPAEPDGERDDDSTAALKEFQKSAGLEQDGIPGPKTCGALDDAVAKLAQPAAAQQQEAPKPAPDCPQEAELRKKIVEVARKEVGMKCAGPGTYREDPMPGKIPGYFKVAFGHENRGAYCAAFATYCWKTAGVTDMKSSAWVPALYKIFEKAGRIIPPGGTPKPGDLIFVQHGAKGAEKHGEYQDVNGLPWPCHVGLVEKVENGKIISIEGNWNPGDNVSGVYVVSPATYKSRVAGYGSLTVPGQPQSDAPKPEVKPHPPAKELVVDKPTLLWGSNFSEGGGIVDLRLHCSTLAKDAGQPVVMLTGSDGKQVAAESPGAAMGGVTVFTFPGFLQIFIYAPHAADGATFKASVTVPLADGTRPTVSTDDSLTIGVHACDDCKAIDAIGDDAAFSDKVHSRGGDAKAITAVQKMLVKFGYDLGKSKKFPDGADGSWGETGAHALRWFVREASSDAPAFLAMNPFHPAKDVPVKKLLMEKCAAKFKKTWPRPPVPPSTADADAQVGENRPLPPITSGKIRVAGQEFADWFNSVFLPPRKVKTHFKSARGEDELFFENRINAANFRKMFDSISSLSGKDQTPVTEFIAFFGVFYNEQGGKFRPDAEAYSSDELKNFTYLFTQVEGHKSSYNRPLNKQKLAGDQLFARGAISADEVAVWNQATPFPEKHYRPELKGPLRECDFYKFQGRGLTQITWREAYEKYVVPALSDAGGYKTDLDAITTDELQKAFEDPNVYLRAVYHEWHAGQVGRALPDVDVGPAEFFWVGYHISGSIDYGLLYHLRCTELLREMIAGNYSCR